jgi:hypothetical protein
MALKNCKECGREVSAKADKCPNCGAPIKAKGPGCLSAIFIIGAFLFIVTSLTDNSDTKSKPSPAREAFNRLDKSPEMQARRKDLLQKLINEGIFYKVEKTGDYPHVYVNTQFYLLSIDDKKSFVNAAFAYFLASDPKVDFLMLYDAKNGKIIGNFSATLGLKLD